MTRASIVTIKAQQLGNIRLGLVTTYTPNVAQAMQDRFEAAGIQITMVGSFYEDNDEVVARIDPTSFLEAALAVGSSNKVDGIFISCTSLRAAGIIEHVETALCNQSLRAITHLLRLVGIGDNVEGFGRLFRMQLETELMT